jgi:hypothetical protein
MIFAFSPSPGMIGNCIHPCGFSTIGNEIPVIITKHIRINKIAFQIIIVFICIVK